MKIENNLNIWKYEEYNRWYRIDRKIAFFFRKIKWMFQRAKYGYCDRDLWNLDYTLGSYIANCTDELANRTHSYPGMLMNYEEWQKILKKIAYLFYTGVNEDCWENPLDVYYIERKGFDDFSEEKQEEIRKNWFEIEKNYELSRQEKIREGFDLLKQWFPHLWD